MHLVVRELVQQPAHLHLFRHFHDISITSAGSRCYDVLVEWPRDKYDDNEEIDHGAHGAHSFGAASCEHGHMNCVALAYIHFCLFKFAEILALESPPYKGSTQPSYQGIAGGEGQSAKSNRGD
jgi:hypothetical protein